MPFLEDCATILDKIQRIGVEWKDRWRAWTDGRNVPQRMASAIKLDKLRENECSKSHAWEQVEYRNLKRHVLFRNHWPRERSYYLGGDRPKRQQKIKSMRELYPWAVILAGRTHMSDLTIYIVRKPSSRAQIICQVSVFCRNNDIKLCFYFRGRNNLELDAPRPIMAITPDQISLSRSAFRVDDICLRLPSSFAICCIIRQTFTLTTKTHRSR